MNAQMFWKIRLTTLLLVISTAFAGAASVPAGINNEGYSRLLRKYVDEKGLVAYSKWKENADDVKALDSYVAQFGDTGKSASGDEKYASLVNAYNAFVLQWILKNYPTESIWALSDSFKGKRHKLGGEMVSLNDIENTMLRPNFGYRTHAVLVCAARSCPPLQQDAYAGDKLDDQAAHAYRTWLSRPDMNEFLPDKNEADISSIFKWFKKDFDYTGGVKVVLERFGPASAQPMLKRKDYKLTYKSYNWGLNDQGSHGRHYSKTNLIFDFLK
jgi:Protein of unknown function, DUF547